jgi:hypothetical protein
MSVTMIRAQVKAEVVDEVEAAATKMFAAIEAAGPTGVRYASTKVADEVGLTFVILLAVEDGTENPLGAVPEFVEFQSALQGWLAGPPTVEQLSVVGSYALF